MNFFRFFGFKKKPDAPWKKYYDKKAMDLNVPDISLYEAFKENMKEYPKKYAYDYYGTKVTYEELLKKNRRMCECIHEFWN